MQNQKLEPGAIVYFKRFKTSTKKGALEVEVQGHGAGVLLGHVAPFVPDIPEEHALRIMGEAGFVSFDDILEFLGPDQGGMVIQKFKEKYMGAPKGESAIETLKRAAEQEPSRLLNAQGAPLPFPPKQNGKGEMN